MKVPIAISVEQADAEVLKQLCAIMGIQMSKLFESTVRGYVLTAKASGILKKKKANPMDLVKLFAAGTQVSI